MSGALSNFVVLYRMPDDHPLDCPEGYACQAEDVEHAEEQCENAYPGCDVVWVWRAWRGVANVGQARIDYYTTLGSAETPQAGSAETPAGEVQPRCPACGSADGLRSVDLVIVTNVVTGWIKTDGGDLAPTDWADGETHWDSAAPAGLPYDCRECGESFSLAALKGTLP